MGTSQSYCLGSRYWSLEATSSYSQVLMFCMFWNKELDRGGCIVVEAKAKERKSLSSTEVEGALEAP